MNRDLTCQTTTGPDDPDFDLGNYHLRLYVAGQTAKSVIAINNLKHVCETYLPGLYEIEVIDLMEKPQLEQATRSWRYRLWCADCRRRSSG